jgi:hypothetical protein
MYTGNERNLRIQKFKSDMVALNKRYNAECMALVDALNKDLATDERAIAASLKRYVRDTSFADMHAEYMINNPGVSSDDAAMAVGDLRMAMSLGIDPDATPEA